MKVTYDTLADAMYLSFGTGAVAETLQLFDCLNVDFDAAGSMLGIEITDASQHEQLVANLKKQAKMGIPIEIVTKMPIPATKLFGRQDVLPDSGEPATGL
jgi:uncharacterized protein YuzE